jgi:hypothetical protein
VRLNHFGRIDDMALGALIGQLSAESSVARFQLRSSARRAHLSLAATTKLAWRADDVHDRFSRRRCLALRHLAFEDLGIFESELQHWAFLSSTARPASGSARAFKHGVASGRISSGLCGGFDLGSTAARLPK